MPGTNALVLGLAVLLSTAACGSREAERAAPEAASMEGDATSDLSTGTTGANPGATATSGISDTPAQQVDQAGQVSARSAPPR